MYKEIFNSEVPTSISSSYPLYTESAVCMYRNGIYCGQIFTIGAQKRNLKIV